MKRSIISEPSSLKGQIKIPGDKSVSHRALICGALASSPTKICNLQRSEDVINTFKVIKNLGIEAEQKENDSNHIQEFTKDVKSLSVENKIIIVETLWRIILSDGKSDIYENNLMRRLAGLLYLDDKIVGEIKVKVLNNK